MAASHYGNCERRWWGDFRQGVAANAFRNPECRHAGIQRTALSLPSRARRRHGYESGNSEVWHGNRDVRRGRLMLYNPGNPFFQRKATNRTSGFTVPTITVGANNTKPAYAEVFDAALVTFDIYSIMVMAVGIAATADNRQCLIDIGIDNNDGGSFSTLINNLMFSQSSAIAASTNITPSFYHFPLFIKAGTQIGARGQTDDTADITGVGVHMMLLGGPKYPEMARAGSYVTTWGANTSTSAGTAITPGTSGGEGTFVDLAGADTTVPHWFFEYGFGVTDQTTNPRHYFVDVGVGTAASKFNAIEDGYVFTSVDERVNKVSAAPMGYYEAPAGVRVYGRASCVDASLDGPYTMTAYGVGG